MTPMEYSIRAGEIVNDVHENGLRATMDAIAALFSEAIKEAVAEQAMQYARMAELHAQERAYGERWEKWWAENWDCSATPGHPGAPTR